MGAPPSSPVEGQCYIVADGATGDWAGHDGALASFTEGGWRHVGPLDGLRALDRASGETWLRRAGSWEAGIVRARQVLIDGQTVLRERQPAIVPPAGGATVDSECRATLGALLAALQAHGLIG